MKTRKTSAILFAWLFATPSIFATVIVDTVLQDFNRTDLPPILRKAVDRRNVTLHTYRVTVNADENKLAQEPIIESLGIAAADLKGVVPAEELLSPYTRKWAYKISEGYGPNCWHTSISSLFLNWAIPRRMPPKEFSCHLANSFEPIDHPSQWGDLIRLSDGDEEVHGFTYLGTDRKDPNKSIVFTKNGRYQSHFLFMDLDGVKDGIYPGNEISFFRRVRNAVDPREDKSAPCYGAMLTDDSWHREE